MAIACLLGVDGQVNCPSMNGFNTCGCSNSADGTIYLDCGNAQLGDAKASQLLQLFINRPLTSIYLAYNRLTKIPNEIAQLNQLHTVYLHGNDIGSIQSNAFNFSSTLKELYLSGISTIYGDLVSLIAPGAFNGNYGSGSIIYFNNNRLTRLESDVFKSVLEKMEPFTYGSTGYTAVFLVDNPIDCVSDPCHLAWLVRDNLYLLTVALGARCSNGTLLRDLNPTTICRKLETFVCPSAEGYFANPSSCSSFYQCSNYISYKFNCPAGLVFNPSNAACDYEVNVPSCRTN